jgi:hypothetical protein
MQQFGVKQQCPSFGVYLLTRVSLAAYLSWCDAHQGVTAKVVGGEAVGEILQRLVADKDAIDIIVVEGVATVFQLVIVNHRDERMQLGRTDVSGVVVDIVNFQYFIHCDCKVTLFSSKKE